MAASLMVVVLLVLFLFIPACIALFMSGRSLLLIFVPRAVRLLPLRLQDCLPGAGLSRWGWGRHHSFSTLSGCTRLTV